MGFIGFAVVQNPLNLQQKFPAAASVSQGGLLASKIPDGLLLQLHS